MRAASWAWSVIVVAIGLVLAGCCRSQAAVPVDAIAMATVTWFITTRGWKVRKGPGDKQVPASVFEEARQRAGFLFVRARRLLERNPAWGSEPEQPTLRTRLATELDQVEAAVTPLVGTVEARGPLYGGTDPLPPERQHLDLGPLVTHLRALEPPPITTAEALAADPPGRREALVLEALDKRRARVVAIGWRAAAADDDVWSESGQLRGDELHALIDRRLHAVELAVYRLSSGAREDRIGTSAVDRTFLRKEWHGAYYAARVTNSFVDDRPHRVIEPPSLPAAQFRDVIPDGLIQSTPELPRMLGTAGEDPYLPTTSSVARPWYLNTVTGELDWNLWPGTQVLPLRQGSETVEDPPGSGRFVTNRVLLDPSQQTWQLYRSGTEDRRDYAWVLDKDPNIDAALEIEKLFRPKGEWWWRPWLHADGAFSAVHLEALRFGLLRRTGSTDAFNAMASGTTIALEDAFGIRSHAQVPDHPLKRGRTEYFENETARLDELQVGDQVLVESLLPFLLASWWEYPTCLISQVDVDPQTGRVAFGTLSVAGFVTAEQELASYRRLVIALAQQTLDELRVAVGDGQGWSKEWDPARPFSSDQSRVDLDLLHEWSPYEHRWDKPGPWWVRIHLDNPLWTGVLGDDVESVMLRLPKSVAWIDEEHVAVHVSGQVVRVAVTEEFEPPPLPEPFDVDEGDEPDPHRCVFVPLYEPFGTFSDGTNSVGWYEFLESAAMRAELGKQLQPVNADGAWVTGLVGAPDAVRVIRPRPRKS